MDLPDDWYVEHDGQRLVLDPHKVAAEIERISAKWIAETRENERLRAALADTIPALERHWAVVGGGPEKSARLATLRRAKELSGYEPRPPGSIIDPKNVPASAAWAAEMRATDEQSEKSEG